jgi:D-aminopeptidase
MRNRVRSARSLEAFVRNLITDVPGIRIGNAHDAKLASGVTVALFDAPTVAGVAVLGGGPGTRETDMLAPENVAPGVDAIVLAGGSAFGLDAASGVQAWLRENGRGLQVGAVRVPLVAQAIMFDLLNGGDKDWERYPPYRELAHTAVGGASDTFALGSNGAGLGATTVTLQGGLGSASAKTSTGFTVGALVVVNSISSAVIGDGPHFWAAAYEDGSEFGGLGLPAKVTPAMRALTWKGAPVRATTIALVATDARFDKGTAKRMAISAHGGLHKALRFAHGYTDGDTVFAAATGRNERAVDVDAVIEICAVAGDCLARAIARGVYEATALPGSGLPAWKDKFGG